MVWLVKGVALVFAHAHPMVGQAGGGGGGGGGLAVLTILDWSWGTRAARRGFYELRRRWPVVCLGEYAWVL